MSDELKLIEPDDENESVSTDELNRINFGRFKFNCLGMGCLGWMIILVSIIIIYLAFRK